MCELSLERRIRFCRPIRPFELIEGVIRVAESAVGNLQDVTRYREQGAHAVLIGEALVTGENPMERVKEFVAA